MSREPPAEEDVLPGVVGRDQAEQITRLDFLRRNSRSDSRVGTQASGSKDAAIQDDDDDAVARVGGELEPLARARGTPPVRRPAAARRPGRIRTLDRLRLAVLEDLEIVAGQPFDDPPLDRRDRRRR